MKNLKKLLVKLSALVLLIALDVVTTIAINKTRTCAVEHKAKDL